MEEQSEKGYDEKLQKKYQFFLRQIRMRVWAYKLFTLLMCIS